jgi:hypothetical protein
MPNHLMENEGYSARACTTSAQRCGHPRGIETKHAFELLTTWKCDEAQG